VEGSPWSASERVSFGLERRFRIFEILEIALLFLRLQKYSGLAPNQNLPFQKKPGSALGAFLIFITHQRQGSIT
jgi:hypothetical protein